MQLCQREAGFHTRLCGCGGRTELLSQPLCRRSCHHHFEVVSFLFGAVGVPNVQGEPKSVNEALEAGYFGRITYVHSSVNR